MSSQNSKTCKSCHSYDNMDHAKQSPAAALAMKDAAAKNMNCIECHKGIAHELPNMAGGFRATYATLVNDAQERQPPRPSTTWVKRSLCQQTEHRPGRQTAASLPHRRRRL